eukprot:scaffold2559_cov103-Isochrysis_galbana.AAC.1
MIWVSWGERQCTNRILTHSVPVHITHRLRARARAPFFLRFAIFSSPKLHSMSKRYRATETARPTHNPRVASRPTTRAGTQLGESLLRVS